MFIRYFRSGQALALIVTPTGSARDIRSQGFQP